MVKHKCFNCSQDNLFFLSCKPFYYFLSSMNDRSYHIDSLSMKKVG